MMLVSNRPGAWRWVCLMMVAVFFLSTGCIGTGKGRSGPLPALVPVTPGEKAYPAFGDDLNFEGLEEALLQSLAYYSRLPETRTFAVGDDRYSLSVMVRSVVVLLNAIQEEPTPEALSRFIRENYQVYRSTGRDGKGDVLFTGYYEAELTGHTEQTEQYRYPVLTRPDDLVTIDISRFPGVKSTGKRHLIGRVTESGAVVPYYTRNESENGSALLDRTEILAWVDDPVDLFFLEIQGSGVITMENGEELRVHYQTKNGHPYRSIGRYLIQQGLLEREAVSMQTIRQWLDENPERRQEVFNYNPSMVFFKEEAKGPLGCYSVPVTPNRSIATDKRQFPACGIAFITTEKPGETTGDEVLSWESFGRFVVNQDTGGAIKGPGRVDLFTGHGPSAELTAGHMKQPGSLYFLVLKPSAR
ncbi:murein transglycosylase A [Desulfoluna spongiiphila]|uniref:murein transglycosylase A n=1 Tax=Desulfoluna spongiiphila TaxID=419481 RepID=UPI001255E5DD|nr:MltA domain-containing protein [Desulfoluna spongiiphila]VVS92932.1 membrane-bound lytic murein transglycosylase a [Desulfoluna spongiiphila]